MGWWQELFWLDYLSILSMLSLKEINRFCSFEFCGLYGLQTEIKLKESWDKKQIDTSFYKILDRFSSCKGIQSWFSVSLVKFVQKCPPFFLLLIFCQLFEITTGVLAKIFWRGVFRRLTARNEFEKSTHMQARETEDQHCMV